jgi:hypothetical protein
MFLMSQQLILYKIMMIYIDQFRYIQHIVIRGWEVQGKFRPYIDLLDSFSTCISIDKHCSSGLQSLSLTNCNITDNPLIIIFEQCSHIISLKLHYCHRISDTSIISLSHHCTGLQSLNLTVSQITDASIISISTHCTGLQSLNLDQCHQITDASIVSISTHCTVLQSLDLDCFHILTDASVLSISSHCSGLQALHLNRCYQITDASIISISTHCVGL